MTLHLKNATFVDWRSLDITPAHLVVEEGNAGKLTVLPPDNPPENPLPDDRVIDCRGKVVTRSFGCGHHHIYSTLARGMPPPAKIPVDFTEILKYVWWHLDKQLDLDMIEASAQAAAVFCAKNGVTFVIDHHSSPFAAEGALFTIARAFDRVGLSHMLCIELSDRDGEGPREAGLAETDRFLAAGRQGHVGLHASFTVSPDLLGRAVDLARKHNAGLHMHVAEDLADQEDALETYGCRVVERLEKAGVLDLKKSILSHCLHLSDREKELIGDAGAWIVQNTESNQNNNVGLTGYAPWTDNVMLGTDGMHSDMLRSAKAAFLAGQATEGLGFDGAYARFRNVHRYIAETGGRGDGDNNLVILDYDSPTELNSDNFLGHFIFGIESRHVHTVIARGKVIVDARRVVTVDETEVLGFAREMGLKLWDRMKKAVP